MAEPKALTSGSIEGVRGSTCIAYPSANRSQLETINSATYLGALAHGALPEESGSSSYWLKLANQPQTGTAACPRVAYAANPT